MRSWFRRHWQSPLRECKAIAIISAIVGLDWMFEDPSNFSSPVYEEPIKLFSWIPGLHAMQPWGLMFFVGGILLFFSESWWARLTTVSFGVGSWIAIGWVAGHEGFGNGQVGLGFTFLCTYFSLRLMVAVMDIRIPFREPATLPHEVTRVYSECPVCGKDIPIPIIVVRQANLEGVSTVDTEPDMRFVWEHAEEHDGDLLF